MNQKNYNAHCLQLYTLANLLEEEERKKRGIEAHDNAQDPLTILKGDLDELSSVLKRTPGQRLSSELVLKAADIYTALKHGAANKKQLNQTLAETYNLIKTIYVLVNEPAFADLSVSEIIAKLVADYTDQLPPSDLAKPSAKAIELMKSNPGTLLNRFINEDGQSILSRLEYHYTNRQDAWFVVNTEDNLISMSDSIFHNYHEVISQTMTMYREDSHGYRRLMLICDSQEFNIWIVINGDPGQKYAPDAKFFYRLAEEASQPAPVAKVSHDIAQVGRDMKAYLMNALLLEKIEVILGSATDPNAQVIEFLMFARIGIKHFGNYYRMTFNENGTITGSFPDSGFVDWLSWENHAERVVHWLKTVEEWPMPEVKTPVDDSLPKPYIQSIYLCKISWTALEHLPDESKPLRIFSRDGERTFVAGLDYLHDTKACCVKKTDRTAIEGDYAFAEYWPIKQVPEQQLPVTSTIKTQSGYFSPNNEIVLKHKRDSSKELSVYNDSGILLSSLTEYYYDATTNSICAPDGARSQKVTVKYWAVDSEKQTM